MKLNRQMRSLIALALIVLAAYIADIPLPDFQNHPDDFSGTYRVVRVSDGDTVVIDRNGRDLPVRLIGIDSPEVDSSYTKSECYGTEASAEAKRILTGTTVRLEIDGSQDLYDAYDRLLAYVYIASGTTTGMMVNEHMVREGYAREYTYRNAYSFRSDFVAAEKSAKSAQKGLWNPASCS